MGVKIREKKTKKGISLYLDISFNGKRKYEFLKIYLSGKRIDAVSDKEKLELAKHIRSQREYELIVKENDLPDKKKRNADFTQYFHNWVYIILKGQRFYDGAFKKFKGYIQSELVRFSDLDATWLVAYQDYLLSELSNNGTVQYMGAIRTVLNYAVKDGIISKNPFYDIPEEKQLKKVKKHIEFLTEDEIQKLMKTETKINPQFKEAFIFCCFSGLRISDVSKLQWSEIVSLTVEKRKVTILNFQQQKTSSSEFLPLSKEAEKIIAKRRYEVEVNEFASNLEKKLVFPALFDKTGTRSTHAYVNRQLKKLAIEAGLTKNLHFHMSRHTFATMLLSNGVDIATVSKLMGHKSIETTLAYLHVINQNKIDAVDKLPTIYEPVLRKAS